MESKKSFKALPTKKEFLRTALFQEQVQIDYDDRGVGFRLLCLSSGRLVLLICSPWQSIADQQISTSNAEWLCLAMVTPIRPSFLRSNATSSHNDRSMVSVRVRHSGDTLFHGWQKMQHSRRCYRCSANFAWMFALGGTATVSASFGCLQSWLGISSSIWHVTARIHTNYIWPLALTNLLRVYMYYDLLTI